MDDKLLFPEPPFALFHKFLMVGSIFKCHRVSFQSQKMLENFSER